MSDSNWNGFTTANSPEWVAIYNKRAEEELVRISARRAAALEAMEFLASAGIVNTPGFLWVDDGRGADSLIEKLIDCGKIARWREDAIAKKVTIKDMTHYERFPE